MPAQIHVNEDDQFTSLHVEGLVTANEVRKLLNSALTDTQFHTSWPQLVDLRNASVKPDDKLEALLKYVHNTYRPHIKAAIAIVLSNSIDTQLFAQAYRIVCNMPDTEIFDDYAQALKWMLTQSVSLTAQPSLQHPNAHTQGSYQYPKEKRA